MLSDGDKTWPLGTGTWKVYKCKQEGANCGRWFVQDSSVTPKFKVWVEELFSDSEGEEECLGSPFC